MNHMVDVGISFTFVLISILTIWYMIYVILGTIGHVLKNDNQAERVLWAFILVYTIVLTTCTVIFFIDGIKHIASGVTSG